jgi:hypothetical protein
MIKFFRKIRQRLVVENKFSKYLLYAIGEIILVVIGILIALQINNANEVKKARKQEVKYLKNLQADVLSELKNNDTIIAFRSNKAMATARMLNFKKLETTNDILELEQTVQTVFWWTTFIPTNNTYKELLSSGNLNFIKNDSIKNFLLELDKKYVFIDNGEDHMKREFEEYLYNPSIENGDMLNIIDFQKTADSGTFTAKDTSQIHTHIVLPQYQKLLENHIFKNGLKLSIMNNTLLKGYHQELKSHLQKLNELIEDDLKKN